MRAHDGFEWYARHQPHTPFALCGDRQLTYAEADALANRIGHALAAAGVGHGDRFAFCAKNSAEVAVLFVAGMKTGAVPVPLNYRLAAPEWAHILDDAGCRVVFGQGELVGALDVARGDADVAATWVAIDADPPIGWVPFDRFVADQPETKPPDEVDADDVLYQMYTSGTTGLPKGVLLTHRNAMVNVRQVQGAQRYRPSPGDRVLIAAPMYHASGAISVVNACLDGQSLVIHADFDPEAVVDALSTGGVGLCTLVPVMIQMCLAVPGALEREYSLRALAYGASPIAEPVLAQALDTFGCEMGQGFGQTEASACLTFLTMSDHERILAGETHLLGSVGLPLAGTSIRVVDPDGHDVGPGVVGEILARGPQVMRGYWNAPEQTASTLRDGWLHTGDAGELDADGYLYIRDRVKDMIVSGGSNVYSAEVERAVLTHPAVADAAVIGVPDDRWGETVMAVVVLAPGARLTLDELDAHCRDRLGGYKVPRRLEIADALPRNASGKVLKHELRAPHWAGRDRGVS